MAFDDKVRVHLLQHKECVGYADRALKQAAARWNIGGRVLGDEAGEGRFELPARICSMAIMVSSGQSVGLNAHVLTSPCGLGIVLEVSRRHALVAQVISVEGCC